MNSDDSLETMTMHLCVSNSAIKSKSAMKLLQCSLCIFLVSAGILPVRSNSVVKQSTSPYACCESPTIRFNPNGKTSFFVNKKTIAIHKNTSSKCISPCKKIEGGQMELDYCANVNSTMVYYTHKNVIGESRTYYLSEPCTGCLPGPHGLLLLLAAAITGLFEIY